MEDVYEECYEEDYKHRRIIKSKGYLFPKKGDYWIKLAGLDFTINCRICPKLHDLS